MHYRWLYVPLTISAVLAWCIAAGAEEPVPSSDSTQKTVTIVTSAGSGEIRDYKVDFQLEGSKPGAADAVSVYFKIRHAYATRQGEDLLPMEITLLEGRVITQGQALEITPTIYPRLTVLLDNHFHITDVFGASISRFSQGTPGINYGNLIILFYLPDGDTPHAIGSSWQGKIKLPSSGQAYEVVNTLQGVETVDGVEAAKVDQQITITAQPPGTPDSHMKCTVQSYFSLQNGKLLKSHAVCEVDLPPDSGALGAPAAKTTTTTTAPTRAKVNIDVALVK